MINDIKMFGSSIFCFQFVRSCNACIFNLFYFANISKIILDSVLIVMNPAIYIHANILNIVMEYLFCILYLVKNSDSDNIAFIES